MTDSQTEARAIAQTSLWVPAKPEHAKLGWTYDFEQTERISRAAYDSTGYEATMEVVEFVMAEADRRHAAALAAKDAELAAANHAWRAMKDRAHAAEAQLAEARKALEFYANPIRYNGPNQRNSGNDPYSTGPYILSVERDNGEIARRAREQGGK